MHLDTGVILELFARPRKDPLVERIVKAIADEPILWSVLQFGELADACRWSGASVEEHVDRVRALVEVVPLEAEIALEGSALKEAARRAPGPRDFSLMDGMILASARSRGQRLLTTDPDFTSFPDAIVLLP